MKPHRNILTKIFLFVKKNIFVILLNFLLISLSFALGIIKGSNILQRPPLYLSKEVLVPSLDEKESLGIQDNNRQTKYVASTKGKYYYPLDCPLVNNLSEKNRVYFNSQEEAEAKGYLKNSKCDY